MTYESVKLSLGFYSNLNMLDTCVEILLTLNQCTDLIILSIPTGSLPPTYRSILCFVGDFSRIKVC